MHIHALAMVAATVGTGDAAAALALETRKACALAGTAIANTLIAALAVEVCLIPIIGILFAG